MCLAIPGKLIEVGQGTDGVRMGKANFGGITKQVCLEYTPDAKLGDYILVHVGFAIGTVDEAEAARTFAALKDLEQLGELDAPQFDPAIFEKNGGSP
jgi:hydrogenase expression/formation protein HypC